MTTKKQTKPKKHIRLFLVTFKNPKRLEATLPTLFKSDLKNAKVEVFIINNHTYFKIPKEFEKKVKVIHNVGQPDFSTGHLSRNWNLGLMYGFESLSNPACDIVVLSQDDTLFHPDWVEKLVKLHEKYTFIQSGRGDNIMSYLPDAVKKIGMWDERFCGISFQAADYFLRALMYNNKKSSINDPHHTRVHNPIFPDDHYKGANYLIHEDPREIDVQYNQASIPKMLGKELMIQKYGKKFQFKDLQNKLPKKSLIPNYIYYPYFEKDVEDLKKKNYMWASESLLSKLKRKLR